MVRRITPRTPLVAHRQIVAMAGRLGNNDDDFEIRQQSDSQNDISHLLLNARRTATVEHERTSRLKRHDCFLPQTRQSFAALRNGLIPVNTKKDCA
jgi:hypothetical protein